jgi:hypothetical protein
MFLAPEFSFISTSARLKRTTKAHRRRHRVLERPENAARAVEAAKPLLTKAFVWEKAKATERVRYSDVPGYENMSSGVLRSLRSQPAKSHRERQFRSRGSPDEIGQTLAHGMLEPQRGAARIERNA